MNEYLLQAHSGQNQWWRYVLSLIGILFFWLIIGSIPLAILVITAGGVDPTASLQEYLNQHPVGGFVTTMLTFPPLLLATLAAVRWIHGRPLRTLFTSGAHINWRRVAVGFGLWFLLAAAAAVGEALLYPDRYSLSFDPASFAVFLPLSLLLIPIQTSAEEVFFRGYLLQALGLRVRKEWLLAALNGLLFTLPHLSNPEVQVNFWLVNAFYFAFGATMTLVTLRDASLDLALGAHAANNLFAALVANYPQGALTTSPIFTVAVLDPVYSLVSSLVVMAVFYVVLVRMRRS